MQRERWLLLPLLISWAGSALDGSDARPRNARDVDIVACPTNHPDLVRGKNLLYAGLESDAMLVFESFYIAEQKRDHPEPVLLACVLNFMALTEARKDASSPRVVVWLERAVDLPLLPPSLSGQLYANLASALMSAGQAGRAEEMAIAAISVLEPSLGSAAPETLFAVGILANTHLFRGATGRAEPLLRRVVRGFEISMGPESYEFGIALVNLGQLYLTTHRYSQARETLQKGLLTLEKNPAKRWADDIPMTKAFLALALASEHRHSNARDVLKQLEAEAEHHVDISESSAIIVAECVARARLLVRDLEAGKQAYDRVIMMLQRSSDNPKQVVASLQRYRRALLEVKDTSGARLVEARLKQWQ